jgi:hypothetical protein
MPPVPTPILRAPAQRAPSRLRQLAVLTCTATAAVALAFSATANADNCETCSNGNGDGGQLIGGGTGGGTYVPNESGGYGEVVLGAAVDEVIVHAAVRAQHLGEAGARTGRRRR